MTTALVDFNRSDTQFPATGYPELLAEQAARTPRATALVQGDRSWTYAELDAATNRLAHALIERGAAPGERVGLCYPRGAEYVLGSLAVLKTGAAVVALDPVNPDDRLAAMIADAAPLLVLTPADLAPRIPGGVPLAEVPTAGRGRPDTAPAVVTGPDTVSHLIYTSGSTGTPKAVLERHGALTNLVHWTRRAYGVRPGDRASWTSTPGFAVQIMEWLAYLPAGAAIHIPEAGQAQTPEQIRDWLVREGITHTMLVAALAEPAWQLEWPADCALRILVTTAERVHSWPPVDTPFRVVMTYGTTETTNVLSCLDLGTGTDFTSQATSDEVRATRQVPVGVPIANLRVHLLDDDGRPVAEGEVGRLHVSGAGVAAGYHGRPELTAARFHPNFLPDDPHPVLYETGDLARRREDGAVELLGRSDSQVKIRGFRVELGEVETHIARLDTIAEAVVVVQERGPGDKRLVAYVSPAAADGAASALPDSAAVRAEVARTLPYYMVPASVVVLPALPRLPNGKVDRRSLPEPPEGRDGVGAGYEAPRNEIEDGLTRLWAEAFRTDGIGIHDNFFELGGHSLLAFQLIDEIRRRYSVELSLSDLSTCPTVAELAALVTSGRTGAHGSFGGLPAIVPDPAGRFDPFPLTESQQALWIGRGGLVELGNVGCHGYFEWESEQLDVPRFEGAWRRLVERHDALRTRVLPDGTQQVFEEIPAYEIPVTDFGALAEDARTAELAALRETLSHQVLDGDSWPLFDVRVSLLGGGRARIHLSLDFLVADAWSYFQVLIPDLVTYYVEPGAELAPLELTFRDYVLAVGDSLRDSELYRRSEWYWRDRLATLPPAPALPERPADAPELPVRFERRSHVVAPELWARIQERAHAREVTPSGALAAAYAEILGTASGQARFTINFPLFNRLPLHPQVNSLLADTTTTLLLAVEQQDDTFAGRAQAVQRRLWADLEHRYFSGVQVLRELTRMRGSLAPAMPVVMTSLAGHPPQYEETELGAPVYGISQTPQVSLDFQVFEKPDGLTFNWDFLPAVYPDGLVDAMFDEFTTLLESLGEDEAWERHSPPPGDEAAAPGRTEARDTGDAWERYWAGIRRTGRGGDVIWDADSGEEFHWLLGQAQRHFEPGLPVIDLGCGNGRYSRELAPHYPSVIGVDVSASAIDHAKREARGTANVDYLAIDMTDAEQAAVLGDGPYNIFVRGVFHVLDQEARARLAAVAGRLLGSGGTLIVHEPDYSSNSFGYLGFVGGKRGRAEDLVGPLEAAGVRHSNRFTRPELAEAFGADAWEVVEDEAIELHAIDPQSDSDALRLPGYYAVLRRKP
ncbi:amino acid adenylation domain-containing protein [Streptomyces subrutilus]|uniref:amino acid adenylation domain-containing protein n=1 Tax=Streptomyces subrutilus TaxID=36818 RepID=UPI002E15F589|nr:amino acid adenylation domain-containing protein [Streptomyces subrutilus]